MAKMVVRYYTIPSSAKSELPMFLEKLSRCMVAKLANVVLVGSKVRVELYGSEMEIFMSLERIRKLLSSYRKAEETRAKRGRLKTVSSDELRAVGGARVSLDMVAEYLKKRGYSVELKTRRSMETNAPRKAVEEAAKTLGEAVEKLSSSGLKTSGGAAKALAVLAALTGMSIEDLVKLCREEGLLEETEAGKLIALRSWTSIVEEALERIRSRSVESSS